ncbi:hypothetical protein ACF0H5_012223 [Mactra antiquata]
MADELWSDWSDATADDIASILNIPDTVSEQHQEVVTLIQNPDSEAWENEPLIKFTTNKSLLRRFRSQKRRILSNRLQRSSKKQ